MFKTKIKAARTIRIPIRMNKYLIEKKSRTLRAISRSAPFSSFTSSKASVTEGRASSTPAAIYALSSAESYSIFSPVLSSIFLMLFTTTDSILSGLSSIVSVLPAM